MSIRFGLRTKCDKLPTSPLRSSQRAESLSTLFLSGRLQDLVWFPLSNPHEGEGNTNFLRSTRTLVTPGQHLVCLGDKSQRVTNTWRSLMKCFEWQLRESIKNEAQMSPMKLRSEWSLRERDLEIKRVYQSICKSVWWPPKLRERGGRFIAPQGNLAVGMSETRTWPG
jgi:hypothetical protein